MSGAGLETLIPFRDTGLQQVVRLRPEGNRRMVREYLGADCPRLDHPTFQLDYVLALELAVRRYRSLEMDEGLRQAFADVFL